ALLLAASLSEFHVAVAAAAQSAGLGRVRGLYLLHRFAVVLVYRPGTRLRHHARQGEKGVAEETLRDFRSRLARRLPALVPLSDGVPASCGPFHAAGCFGPHRGQLRLRNQPDTRLAYHHLSALLRRRRH